MANSLLQDFSIISDYSNHEVINAAKIRREKLRVGDKEVTKRQVSKLKCIRMDSKRTKNARLLKINEKDGEKFVTKCKETVEYITYTIE